MPKKNTLATFVLHIHDPKSVGYTAISEEAYRSFFGLIDPSVASKMAFQKPQEVKFSTDVLALVNKFKKILSKKRKTNRAHTLLLEMLDTEADVRTYDDLCNGIYLALCRQDSVTPWCIGLIVSDQSSFMQSVFLQRRLIPECQKKNIGLLLLDNDQKAKSIVLCQGKLPEMEQLPRLQVSNSEEQVPPIQAERLNEEQVANRFRVLFGHFEVTTSGSKFHIPAVASVIELAMDAVFIDQFHADIIERAGDEYYKILPIGLSGGGIKELCFNMVEGNLERIIDHDSIDLIGGSPIALVCDFISNIYYIDDLVRKLRESGSKKIIVAGIGRYADYKLMSDLPYVYYIDSPYVAYEVGVDPCPFCAQEVKINDSEHFQGFVRSLERFDSFTFWEFISQRDDFFEIGHWPSPRTPNHYLFRIKTDPIFKRHGYDLCLRVKNLLKAKHIAPGWVKRIICTEGEESSTFSMRIAEVLGLQSSDVIRIPRKYFASMAGKELGPELLSYIKETYGATSLREKNVLIVDQAAHHFKTLSALRNICEHYDCTILAFVVFIDRTGKEFSLGEYLHDSHYLALYSWPVPPRRAYECPCVENVS